ncbi:MAG: hypothetical protein MPEBLZ_00767 [Candidatus Methanoperedens nitroreducens]|uniref:DUF11 domain-containing protein n=1 Tax=Candidatus Methanoperedens nitratireducens TaxID=1392998 RepID=A0A0P8E2T4_9EURY|nr:MAG: hypothetical protein MPEBLZ_00767 [Candidatus Methanoperedens sp. BLZ1]
MRYIYFLLAITIVVSFTVDSVLADDCEDLNEQKICWGSNSSTTLSWTNPRITSGEYLIEARDFNWLGSISIRVTKNGAIQEGVLSEGEYYLFDFSNNSTFNGIKIIADQVSNINSFPSNIGTFPSDPQAKISFKLSIPKEKEKPTLEISIIAENETKKSPGITANITIQNSGDSDLIETQVRIIYDGLELNEFDFEENSMNEITASGPEIKWENVSSYKLTPTNSGIIKNGYNIQVLNFSNKTAIINTSYNGSMKSDVLMEGGSIIFGYTRENEYTGIKILGIHISNDAAELVLQVPVKNSLKRRYPVIPGDSNESINLGFKIPGSSRKMYKISVIASGKDREGNNHVKSATTTVLLQNTFNIKKIISNSILGENLYPEYSRVRNIGALKNITYITISVVNLQNYPVHNVTLRDMIPPGFNFMDNSNRTSVSWDFDINSNDHKEFTYAITAKRQGIYNIPKAELTWDEWGEFLRLESNGPRTSVSGPYIVMERSFNKSNISIGETLSVSLSLTNNGDIPTNILVNDSVPRNATFISGTLSFSGFLRPREKARIAYTVIADGNIIEFKAPEITSKNQGFEWYEALPSKKISEYSPVPAVIPTIAPDMGVKVPEQVPEQVPLKGIVQKINEEFPWLEGAISIITLIITLLSGIFLLLLLKKKYFRIHEK